MMFSTAGAFGALGAALFMLAGATTTVEPSFTPARPPSVPLGVKSPYLSTWQAAGDLNGGNGGILAGQWPRFWNGQVTGWTGIVRVDGTPYVWLGNPLDAGLAVTQIGLEYTSTRSTFTSSVNGLVELNITFLSPVYPNDQKRQSLVFTYLDVVAQSLDGNEHDVQVYADISAEWVAGDHASVAQWEYGGTTDSIAYHRIYRQEQLVFTETNQQADWGYWYWATSDVSGLSHQSGEDIVVRAAFTGNGVLDNSEDTNYRPINQEWPVFAFARDLGTVTDPVSTVFSLGLAQEEAIRYDGETGVVPLTSLWTSYFESDLDALSFFHNDYEDAYSTSAEFDDQVARDSIAAGGQDYLTITSLSVRQAFGALQLMGNTTKQYLFLKEISSNGNCQTVDVIFPFHPILMYTNPSLLKLLLDPLFETQESGQYPNKYSMHDLGTAYPNAVGHPDGLDEPMPLEECGNMLIMSLAYAQKVGDVDYLSQHYDILKQWTQYLVDEALIPADQISTDDFAGSLVNQTNLALKGIIGIEAFSIIANLTGHLDDAASYTDISHSYITQWQDLGIAKDATPPHTTLSYGDDASHGILYNLYSDTALGLGLVPQSVYDMQSTFYPTIEDQYGIVLDTRHGYTKSDWEIWAAAIASQETKDMLIGDLAKWINKTPTGLPLSDWYDSESGGWPVGGGQFTARPTVGGHFALLALGGSPWATSP